MGVDLASLNFLVSHKEYVRGNTLQLGRQGLHYAGPWADRTGNKVRISNEILKRNGIPFSAEDTVIGGDGHTEKLFLMLGADTVDTLDYSRYENCTIVHDMNLPIHESFHGKFDFIFDSGTIEHIYDVKTVVENIKSMLKIGGVVSITTVCNNFVGHGFYQFSPEFFRTLFSQEAGFNIIDICMHELTSDESFTVHSLSDPRFGDRQEMRTRDNPHYVCFIAQKVGESSKKNYQQSDYLKAWGEI
jgi:SAM-dependent methyltransferase